jgi:hypothetical protein
MNNALDTVLSPLTCVLAWGVAFLILIPLKLRSDSGDIHLGKDCL